MTTIDEIEALLAKATPPGPPAWREDDFYSFDKVWKRLIPALLNAAPDLLAVVRAAAKVVQLHDNELIEALARLGVKP